MSSSIADKFISRVSTFGLSGRPLRATVTVVAAIGFSLFGYDQGVMSSLISSDPFTHEFPATLDNGHNSNQVVVNQGAIVSCYEIGCFFGAIFALLRGEKLGRKPVILLGAIIITIGTVISVASFRESWGTGQFVIGRVITGIGNGMNTATIPVWQSEMSRPENRGRLVYIEGSTVAFGTFIAYWLDYGILHAEGSVTWRFPIAFQAFFSLILLIGVYSLPESPRWLVAANRSEEAKEVLAKCEGCDPEDDLIISELTVITDAVERYADQLGFKEVIETGKSGNLQRILIGSFTQFSQQFTGCNAAIYYSTVLFQDIIGSTHDMAAILGGVFSTVYFLSSIPAYFIVDRVGRRKMFMVGFIGQGISFIITFACLVRPTKSNAKGAAVGLFLYILFFGCTILQLPWVYPPEINSTRTRTVGSALSTCTNWICNFAVVMFTPIFINNAGWGCYLFFAIMNFLSVPVVYFYLPETTGRTLEEMDIIYAKAHYDKTWAFKVANRLPKLTYKEIQTYIEDLGIYEDEKQTDQQVENASSDGKGASSENQPGEGLMQTEKSQ